jgi:hypothetical protein
VRFIVVRDAAKRRQLRDWYVPLWEQYISRATARRALRCPGSSRTRTTWRRHLDEVPALLVVCAQLSDLLATDRHLDA